MNRRTPRDLFSACGLGWSLLVCAVMAAPLPARAAEPGWHAPAPREVHQKAVEWLKARGPDEAAVAKAETLWTDTDKAAPREVLDRLARTFALAEDNARALVDLCSQAEPVLAPPDQPWLRDEKTPPLLAHNLRLAYGIWLVQHSFYDEARDQLAGLRPEDVVDPASLLFYRAVVHHRLLDKTDGLEAVDRLLSDPEAGPKRYAAVARLMREDLSGLKVDTLDHIARRMDDIHRRLDLGRAGPKVRKIEDGVIESLDKLIKKLEEQQQQQQASAAAGGDSTQSATPAQDSTPMGGKGPGQVTKKNIGNQDGWGNLPPKKREEAMQQIGREFPSHYRDAAEQYFRRLAGEGSEEK